jgi:hypothetical protein
MNKVSLKNRTRKRNTNFGTDKEDYKIHSILPSFSLLVSKLIRYCKPREKNMHVPTHYALFHDISMSFLTEICYIYT